MGLLSERSLLAFGMVLSSAVLTAVKIKSAYLSRSLVNVNSENCAEPKAASSVDSNTLCRSDQILFREARKPKCANCKRPHVASYKGCPEYKKTDIQATCGQ